MGLHPCLFGLIFLGAPCTLALADPLLPGLPAELVFQAQNFGLEGGSIAPATEFQANNYRKFVRQHLQLALANGAPSQIEWLHFSDLVSDLDKVDVWLNQSNKAILGSGTRAGSVYFVDPSAVVLNSSLLVEITNPQRVDLPINIGFDTNVTHEFMGALGYPDENLEISTYVRIRHFPQDFTPILPQLERALADHLRENGRRNENITFSTSENGTSTGVGGGGDPVVGVVKHYALGFLSANYNRHFQNNLGASASEFSAIPGAVLLARIEPIDGTRYDRSPRAVGEVFRTVRESGETFFLVDTAAVVDARDGREISLIGFELMKKLVAEMRR